jgi:hypothetical protein
VKVPMKVMDSKILMKLNGSSVKQGRKQNLKSEQIPAERNSYIVNFHFDHELNGEKDVRLSVIMEPGVRTAWLDVSCQEFGSIPEVQMAELEWEAAVCVGVPPWTK